MKHQRIALVALAASLFAGGTLYAVRRDHQDTELKTLSAEAAGISSLLYARPFVLDHSYTHYYRAEQPEVRAGMILVLAVDPELARPRETWNKVLYAGAETAERINHGIDSGRIVVIVPAELDARGEPKLDLATTPIFFGGLELPENVSREMAVHQLADARTRGVLAPDADEIRRARAEGGATLHLPDRVALDKQVIADLILRYSPGKTDADIASGLLR
jgi:hypothetical protein